MNFFRSADKILDITLPMKAGMAIYPGNQELEIQTTRSKTSFISRILMGSHTGTHVDAPRHSDEQGAGVDKLALEAMLGPCRVLDLTGVKGSISAADLANFEIKKGERVLAKTSNSKRGFKKFYPDYVYLSSEAAAYLAKRKIVLFGIDALSVKQKGSEDNRPHTELLDEGIVIFEGLDLSKVKPGEYYFIGLPLKLVDLDGAPARALLLASRP
jgi:arylformamidase